MKARNYGRAQLRWKGVIKLALLLSKPVLYKLILVEAQTSLLCLMNDPDEGHPTKTEELSRL